MAERPLRLRDGDIVWRDLGDEAVVLDQRTWRYLGLNPAGKLMWQALESGADAVRLAELLAERFDLDAGRARRDVDAFLADLRARELIVDDT